MQGCKSSSSPAVQYVNSEGFVKKHTSATNKDHRLHNSRLIDFNDGERPYQAWVVAGPGPIGGRSEFVMRARIDRNLDVFPRIGDICRVGMLSPSNSSTVFHNAERTDGSLVGLGASWRDTMEFKVSVTSSHGFDAPARDFGTVFQDGYEGEAFTSDWF